MINEVGDLVYWENEPGKKYIIECISNEIHNDGLYWIWSSKFELPYLSGNRKNYHRVNKIVEGNLINITKIREKKLKELLD